jgi:hypothetical protein
MTAREKLALSDWLAIACLTVTVFLNRYQVLSSDPLLAWPITDFIAHPGNYSPEDLLVRAGASGNFLLYRLLAHLPLFADNYPLRDFLIYVPIYFLTLLAWWLVFMELGAKRQLTWLALLVLAFSDDKLALNWAHVVPAYFVSASSVQFLQVFGLLFFLRGQRNLALSITAATGYFHPATALSFGAIYTAIVCIDAARDRSWRDLGPAILFAIIFLPNALMIAANSQGGFKMPAEYLGIFAEYQPQAYLGDHFHAGYAYTLALIAFAWRRHALAALEQPATRELFRLIAFGLGGSLVWFANLYAAGNLQLIHSFFVMRIFSLIHPLLVFLALATAVALYASTRTLLERTIVALFALTPLYFSPPVALIIVVACAACAARKPWWPLLLSGLIALYLGAVAYTDGIPLTETLGYLKNAGKGRVGNEFNWFQAGLLLASLPLLLRRAAPDSQPSNATRGSRGLVIILFCALAFLSLRPTFERLRQADFELAAVFDFDPQDYWGLRWSDSQYAGLLDWVRQSPERMYSVPPYDDRFLSFRYLSGKGVFIFHRDIAQLMYSPDYYLSGVRRLREVAGNAPGLPKAFMSGEVKRPNGDYELRCRELMNSKHFDMIVFERSRLTSPECLSRPHAFRNGRYIVFRATGRGPDRLMQNPAGQASSPR